MLLLTPRRGYVSTIDSTPILKVSACMTSFQFSPGLAAPHSS